MRISDWSSDVCSSDLLTTSAASTGGLLGSRLFSLDFLLRAARSGLRTRFRFCNFCRSCGGCCSSAVFTISAGRHTETGLFRDFTPLIDIFRRRRGIIARKIPLAHIDRKSVVSGKRVLVCLDLGGRPLIKKKKKNKYTE